MAYKDNRTSKWVGSISYTKLDGTATRKRKYGFKTKRDAEKWERDNENYQEALLSSEPTIDEIAKDYLISKKNTIQITSYQKIEVIVRLHILPYLKYYKANMINQKVLLQWQNELQKRLTNQRINVCSTIFKEMYLFGGAVYNYNHDPFKKMKKLIVNENKKIAFYTLEEFKRLLDVINDNVYYTFFYTLYFCGFRKGEALALTWNDINFGKKEITISKSVYQKLKDIPYLVKPPKNKSSYRTIKVDDTTLSLLKKLKEFYKENYKSFNDDRFIFGFDRPLHETTINKKYNKYIELAKLDKIRIHDLRHSHASLLINTGANPVLVAKRLGHSDVEETLNTYSHLFEDVEDKVVDLINKTVNNWR